MSIRDGVGEQIDTLREIFSQPQRWNESLAALEVAPELRRIEAMATQGTEWLFVGCGSSYYLSLAAAASFRYFGHPARAIPASEILLYPAITMPKGSNYLPVMISRSGLTSEVVRAAQFLEEERDIRTVAITCTKGQPLENISTETIQLDSADEKSTVMTRSFTSMLLALQYLAASVASSGDFQRALRTLPSQAEPLLGHFAPKLKSFVESRSFEDHVVLAQGPLFGIASEAMLKITECSSSYAQVFHTMEFRHGPKSIVSPETLIVFLLSESSYDAELEVLEEMRSLGASTLVIGNVLDERARKASELSIEMLLTVPEYARLAAYLLWGQLYGTYTGLKKGLNPDNPRNLSRVVVLNDNN